MADNSGTSGLDENVAGLLSYLFGWVTGLIFFLIDKRPFVRFHAMQSIVLSVAIFIVYAVFWVLVYIFWPLGFLYWLLGVGIFILWIQASLKIFCKSLLYFHGGLSFPFPPE